MKQFTLILVFAFIASGAAVSAEPSHAKPNVLLFLVDDMGVMDTSVPFLTDEQGNEERNALNDFYRTPNMERLAALGTRYSQFYANSVCSPTRTSLMNGQFSARHHTTQFIRPENKNTGDFGPAAWKWEGFEKEETTLPWLLKTNDYRTIHCGKAHFGPIGYPAENPLNIGFDVNIAGCSFGQPGSYLGKKNYGNGISKRQKRAVPGLEKYHGTDTHLSEALAVQNQGYQMLSGSLRTPAEFYWSFDATMAKDATTIHTEGRETQVLEKTNQGWRIVHVHYSGMPVTGERQGF